jgi:hypothetical protein
LKYRVATERTVNCCAKETHCPRRGNKPINRNKTTSAQNFVQRAKEQDLPNVAYR